MDRLQITNLCLKFKLLGSNFTSAENGNYFTIYWKHSVVFSDELLLGSNGFGDKLLLGLTLLGWGTTRYWVQLW